MFLERLWSLASCRFKAITTSFALAVKYMSKSPFTSQLMLYLWVKIPSDCNSEGKPSEAPQKLGSHAKFHKPISKCLFHSSTLFKCSKCSVMFAVHWPTFPFNHQPLLPVEHNGPGLEYKLSYRLLGVEDSWKEQMVKRHSFVVRDTPTFVPYEVKIQAFNHHGWAPEPRVVTGYSGEDREWNSTLMYSSHSRVTLPRLTNNKHLR